MELKSWRQYSSSFNNLLKDFNSNDKVYIDSFNNNVNDTDDSELIETRIPPKAATPFIPIESFNHSFFNSVSENSSNYNNTTPNNINYTNTNNILDNSLVVGQTNVNTTPNDNTPKPRKKSVIFKDEVDEVPNDDTSFSLTLERNFHNNFSGNAKYESILQSSPPSQFNSGLNSYDPSPISFNINVSDSEKPILLNQSNSGSPTPTRKPSILKTSIHYHKIIDNTTPKVSNLFTPSMNEVPAPSLPNHHFDDHKENMDDTNHMNNMNNIDDNALEDKYIDNIRNDDTNNDNPIDNRNVDDNQPYFDRPETNTTINPIESNPSLNSSATNSNIDLNQVSVNDPHHADGDDEGMADDGNTTVSSSFSEIPIETLKDFNPDESEMMDEFAAANTSTNIINNMKFKNDTTQSPFISALSFNSLSWNDSSSLININHNGRRYYSHPSPSKTSSVGSGPQSVMRYRYNESESATSRLANYQFDIDGGKTNTGTPQRSSFSSNRSMKSEHHHSHHSHRLNQHKPIHLEGKASPVKTANQKKKEHHDYDNFLEEGNRDLPYFYQQNVKNYQDVNGPYPQEGSDDDTSDAEKRYSSIKPVKNIRYPKHHRHSSGNSSFMGDRTPNGLAIHKGLQLATEKSFIQRTTDKAKDKYWRQLEVSSKKFYNVRKKQRENRFKKIIHKKMTDTLPIAKKVEEKSPTKLIRDFEKLTVRHPRPKVEKDDILIVDPRMIEKLNHKSKILPIQNELDKREINKLNNKPLDVKTLPSSYVFQSLETNNPSHPGPKYDTQKFNTKVIAVDENGTASKTKKPPMLRASSLPVLVHKAKRTDTSLDNPVQQKSPPHPHSPPPKPPSLLHERFEQLYFGQDDYSFIMGGDDEPPFEKEEHSEEEEKKEGHSEEEEKEEGHREEEEKEEGNASNISSCSNATEVPMDHPPQSLGKSFSEPYLKSKYDTKVIQLDRPTLNSTTDYIKNNWNDLRDNKFNFKHLAKQIKEGMKEPASSMGRKTFIDQIIHDQSKKREYSYKNYLTETFGEDRQHLVQNHLDQFKQKLSQETHGQGLTVNGIKINIDPNGDVSTAETKKAIKYISNRIANRVTTVQPSENQYKNLISLQDPVELPRESHRKPLTGTSFIPRAKKVINKSWLASLEIKPPSIEEINNLDEYKEVEIITETSIKLKDNPLEKPYFSDYVTADGHTFLQENNPDHPVPSYSSLLLNLMNAKQFLYGQLPKSLDISEISPYSESISDYIQKVYADRKC